MIIIRGLQRSTEGSSGSKFVFDLFENNSVNLVALLGFKFRWVALI